MFFLSVGLIRIDCENFVRLDFASLLTYVHVHIFNSAAEYRSVREHFLVLKVGK